jgi:hypothetical protein
MLQVPKLEPVQAVLLLRGHFSESLLDSHGILELQSVLVTPLAMLFCWPLLSLHGYAQL